MATIVGTADADTLAGAWGDRVNGLGGDDHLTGGGNVHLDGGDGDDLLEGAGGDRLEGGAGADVLKVTGGFANKLDVYVDGGAGRDALSIDMGGALTLKSFDGDHATVLDYGLLLADTAFGSYTTLAFANYARFSFGTGLDVVELSAAGHAATLASPNLVMAHFQAGDLGDVLDLSTYLDQKLTRWNGQANPFATGHLRLVQSGSTANLQVDYDGGGDTWTLLAEFPDLAINALTARNFAGLAPGGGDTVGFVINGTTTNDPLMGAVDNDLIYGGVRADVLHGLSGDDILWGARDGDFLWGDDGADTLHGGDGGDHLYGGIGGDALDGGGGYDFARYDTAVGGGVVVSLATGLGSAGEATGDTLSDLEGLVGSGYGDVLTGAASANSVFGLGGGDILFGLAGGDMLDGGAGDDHLHGGTGGDVLAGGEGYDFARYDTASGGVGVNLATGLGTAGEATGDTLSGVEGLVGSNYADAMIGDAGPNSLFGLVGDDALVGGAGADVLDGGAGADHLYGGVDGDILIGGEGYDFARYDTASGGVGVNLATGLGSTGEAAGDTLSGVEGLVGSSHADTLTGDAGANTLYGLAGSDHLHGGLGGDTLIGGEGYDFARYDNAVGGGIVVSLATGLGSAGEAAGDVLSEVEGLVGSTYGDVLTGNGDANTLYGLAGDDILFGLAGADTLVGGTGADRFMYIGVGDSAPTAIDRILDFNLAEGDRIDLSGIDAVVGVAGDQAFTLVGALSSHAGQMALQYDANADATALLLDVGGDGVADFTLWINGRVTATDGILL